MLENDQGSAGNLPIPSTVHNRNDNANLDGPSVPASEISRDLLTDEKSPNPMSDGGEAAGESVQARIERLGRERPAKFKSVWAEVGFCFSIVMSQVLTEYFVSGFPVILPTLITSLNIPPASSTWPASAFSLVVSAFLLIFGRLGDMYGGRIVYIAGVAWLAVWSIIAGFSRNELMLDFCRALQGLGPSAFLPTSLMLLGSVYRPGLRKNVVFSIYGACAPLGFYVGIFFAGVAGQFTTWGWYFWIGAILSAFTTAIAWFSLPMDMEERKGLGIKMDWLGAIFIVSGIILVVFAITDSAHAPNGWKTPYIFVLFIVGTLFLVAAGYIEGWVAEMPLLPPDIFDVKYMKPLVIALIFSYGSMGIYWVYASLYMEMIMGGTPLQLAAWYTPTAVLGIILATVGGFVLHLIPAMLILVIAGIAFIMAPLLFAIAPLDASYWAYIFPAMLCITIGIDTTFNVTNIFITTNMPSNRQGLAGALTNSILQLSIAVMLGFADIISTYTEYQGVAKSFKNAFWLEVGLAAAALVILVCFVKVGKAKSELTMDEREAIQKAEVAEMKESRPEEPAANDPEVGWTLGKVVSYGRTPP